MSTSSIVSSATTTPAINISSILAATTGATTPGIDVTSAVAAAIYADRAPERGWQADQATLTSQTTALTAIQTATQAVQNDLQTLNSLAGPLAARSVNSSNANIVSASAASGTTASTHTIVVNSLASTGAWYSDAAASPTAVLPSSSFTLTTTAGASVTIPTGSGQTADNLNDLASTINGDSLGVTASVVSDASGSRLAIISNTSGTAGDFSISSANYTGTQWASADIPPGDTLGTNSFTLTSGGVTTTVSTTTGETYASLASSINAMNLGVTATAGTDANGTNLSIASSDGTTPFTISEPNFGFTQSAAGANASLTVDGVPLTSASNTVTGAISGVSLSLSAADPGVPVTLAVTSNASEISTAVNQFVTDYNTAIGLVNSQFSIASGATSEGVLASDSTVVTLQGALEGAINYAVTPATGTTTTVSTLNDLGITANTDGTLSVNSATLNSALSTNPNDVQNFFDGSALNGFAASMNNALTTFTEPADGAFTVDLSGFQASYTDLTTQISDFETNYIAGQQTNLTATFSAAEIALQELPAQMAQIQAELGVTPSNNNG
jgi:flagellar hook-associated protein 2